MVWVDFRKRLVRVFFPMLKEHYNAKVVDLLHSFNTI